MATFTLNDKFIAARIAEAPQLSANKLFYDDHAKAPRGFALRIAKSGAAAFVLNYWTQGTERRITIGPYGANGTGLSITAARERANKLRVIVDTGGDPLAEKQQVRKDKTAKIEADKAKSERTLGALLYAYIAHLDMQGKAAGNEVRGMVENHIKIAHPKLWATPAIDLQPEDGVKILSPLVAAGKNRMAGKLRSYLRAAYAAAVRARLDASASPVLRALGLRHNALADLPTIKGGTGGARDRALSVAELRAYWRRIAAMNDATGALLRLHLLSGAQRVEQLARTTKADYDADAQVIVLRDPKGRRSEPRVHIVPLIPVAVEAIETLQGDRGPHLFSIDKGKTAATYWTPDARLHRIADAMIEADEVTARFSLGDLRRTVETRLAALGVSLETRAQLQSHGLGGVQARHYDRHSYLDEKRAALESLYRLVTSEDATVTPIKRRKA